MQNKCCTNDKLITYANMTSYVGFVAVGKGQEYEGITVQDVNLIKLSMDGKGRATDNIYIERFWRTIKYEHIYIRPSITVYELKAGVKWFINWYN